MVQVVNSRRLLVLVIVSAIIIVVVLATTLNKYQSLKKDPGPSFTAGVRWEAPDTSSIPLTHEGSLIRYGRDLIANTSYYLGPKGKVAAISNGMNCQNCHLDAGTRSWGNNYSAVFSTYPRFRERSGSVENIYKRVNDCIERSLNGHPLDTNSREMQAMSAYINWVGHKVPKNTRPSGAGIRDIAFLDRSADRHRGRLVYVNKCERCHGVSGQGILNADSISYQYPPLWGDHSYNMGAGLYRLSRFAGYVRDNMPFDAPLNSEPLTDEEAWDVAAYVNSQSRPTKDFSKDYPNIGGKPIDHPKGPFKDAFTEHQHKYGPFEPIKLAKENTKSM